jgi:NTP pyrophosphatase (non-canonical NTP hydrolase)
MANDSLTELTEGLRRFAADREWDQYHTPKNLAAALSVEVAELQEHFLWTSSIEMEGTIEASRSRIAEEIGDVLLYLIRLADKVGIDPVAAAQDKLALNGKRYPVEKARGNHKKYTEL